ncbi:MAG: LCP family protein [Actinomycetes bacterium]
MARTPVEHAQDQQEPWLPARTGGGRRRGGRTVALVLVLLLLAPVLFGVLVALRASGSIERVEVAGLAPYAGGQMNVLVVGSDSREEMTDEQRRELTLGGFDGDRTDTIFVLSVRGGAAAMLAFPRDLWVTRCDGTEQRINTAVQVDGMACLAETVTATSGIPIHHTMVVSFLGFVDIVDAVDGVELCLDAPIADRDAGIDLPAGCQVLGGKDALGYVRVRKIDNDLKRIERQQQFLKALAGELTEPSTLTSPTRLWRVSGQVGGALTADDGLGPIDLGRLGWGMRGIASGRVATFTVPASPANIGGAEVLLADEVRAEPLFASFRDGSVFASIVAPSEQAEVAPEDVRVRVRNGARVEGAAATARDALTARGYVVLDIANAPEQPTTTVAYPADQRAEAELVAREVESSIGVAPQLVEEAGLDAVVLTLGADLRDR